MSLPDRLVGFVDECTFLTKSGHVGVVYQLRGQDAEGLTHSQRQASVHQFEAALRLLDEHYRIYAHQRLLGAVSHVAWARVGVPPAPRCRSERALTAGDGQKLLGALTSATIRGALEYRACDEKARFNPTRVPFSFAESLKGLDRRLPG